MAFTYATDLSTDLAKVRFGIPDTVSPGKLSDAEITALLTSEGSIGGAIVAGIVYIMGLLSQPGFRADWLTVTNSTAFASWEKRLTLVRRQYGIAAIVATTTNVYRADSLQTEAPDYSGDAE